MLHLTEVLKSGESGIPPFGFSVEAFFFFQITFICSESRISPLKMCSFGKSIYVFSASSIGKHGKQHKTLPEPLEELYEFRQSIADHLY